MKIKFRGYSVLKNKKKGGGGAYPFFHKRWGVGERQIQVKVVTLIKNK